MSDAGGMFDGFDLEAAIEREATGRGVSLADEGIALLARHARTVVADEHLHLSTIDDPDEFIARQMGEAFEGAAMLDADVTGRLVDLGSGNGYPGLPFALARPGLQATLLDASRRRAEFLEQAVDDVPNVDAAWMQVQRSSDLEAFLPVRVLTLRAVGAWQKIVPRLAASLGEDGELLLWAGVEVDAIASRASWGKLEQVDRKLIEGRERSWIWRFRARRSDAAG